MYTRILIALTIMAAWCSVADRAEAATITVAYEAGYPDVLINGFGTEGLGTFRLDDGDISRLALCIEADQPHSTTDDAYAPITDTLDSGELDTLIWLLERSPVDDDTAIAAAALAWYYADARRPSGVPVWSDGTREFAPIGPTAPESWLSLPQFSLAHPIGLRSGSIELDRAERKVAELDRQVRALAGPWTLDADAGTGRFRLSGRTGPIAGWPVTITIITPESATTSEATTDQHGHVDVAIPDVRDGAVVRADVDAPGRHRAWDGDGAVQRMITATTAGIAASFEVAPKPRHVLAVKHSSDPTIGIAGATFTVTDSNGVEAGRATSDPAGRAVFAAIDAARHPRPYVVSEVTAPVGLQLSAPDVTIEDASVDPAAPTVVEFTDEPLRLPVTVHKVLSIPTAGPPDRSGFRFRVERRQDGVAGEITSGASGETEPLMLALGTYDVCEVAVPAWAAGLEDGGCRTLAITLPDLEAGSTIIVEYPNIVPSPLVDTAARDARDGDRLLGLDGGVVVDDVTLSGLIPGTTYTVVGALVRVAPGGTTEIVAETAVEFTSDAARATVEVGFEVAPLAAGRLVATERILIGDTLVAVHDDLTDDDQTIRVVPPPTTTTTSTTTSTTTTTPTTTTSTSVPAAGTSTVPPGSTSVPTSTTPPPADVTLTVPQPTLPRTGADAAAQLLRLGDIGFVAGVALIAVTGLLPRRGERAADR